MAVCCLGGKIALTAVGGALPGTKLGDKCGKNPLAHSDKMRDLYM